MATTTANPSSQLASQDVGLIFVCEYYTFLNKKPHRLHAFYNKDSLFVRGDEGAVTTTVKGQEEIRKEIEECKFEDCKVLVTQVDSQVSANNGILIQVLGEMCNQNGPSQKFSQTFFLATQPNGYFILNDIFRFLKDEVEIDYYTVDQQEAVPQPPVVEQQHIPVQVQQQRQPETVVIDIVPSPVPATVVSPVVVQQQPVAVAPAAAATEPVVPAKKQETPKEEKKPVVVEEKKKAVEEEPKKESKKEQQTKKAQEVEEKVGAEPVKEEAAAAPAVEEKKKTSSKSPESSKQTQQQKQQQPQQQKKEATTTQTASNKPKTWANLTASAPPAPTTTTPVTANGTVAPASTTAEKNTNATPASPAAVHTEKAPSQQQQHQQNKAQNAPRREATNIFVKLVTEAINEDQLTEAFNKIGSVKSCSISRQRNCAFIEFNSPESCSKALAQHRVLVNGHTVLAEERRFSNQNTQQNQNQQNRYNSNQQRQQGQQQQNYNRSNNTSNNQQQQQRRTGTSGKGRGAPQQK